LTYQEESTVSTIAFVGLGIMGLPMHETAQLLRAIGFKT
jgi:3-hydroxyisobutyrate dehydrogenase-like beta-hydroxyacid dehydrogenase